jgi:hypothetical protein
VRTFDVVALGIGATLVIDLWGVFLKRVFRVPAPNYCLVGRWLRHMPAGVLRHANIAAASPKSGECVAGWLAHYAIGVAFALVLALVAPWGWLEEPTILPALAVGLATVISPFLILHPAFGLGVAASKTPNPAQARLRSLMTHAAFGVGLYASGLVLSVVR